MSNANIDLGNLLVDDHELFDNTKETRLERTKKCCQLIFDEVANLATKIVDDMACVELPQPTFNLPREKHIPAKKMETKWEAFAKLKGVVKHKKKKFVYDEEKKKYVPSWGKGSKEIPWALDVPENDIYGDQFAKYKAALQKPRDLNESKRIKNLGRMVNVTKTSMNNDRVSAGKTNKLPKLSDASMGKFTREIDPSKLRKEVAKEFNKGPKAQKATKKGGRKPANNDGKRSKNLVKKNPMKKKGSRTGNKRN